MSSISKKKIIKQDIGGVGYTTLLESAYLLIQCDLGAEEEIIKQISNIAQVQEVRGTFGIYDIFCKVQTESRETLDEIITTKIRKIPKIRVTITLHWIPSQGGR